MSRERKTPQTERDGGARRLREIDTELGFHLEGRTAELEAEGMNPVDARTRALQEFGDLESVRGECQRVVRRVTLRERAGRWLASLAHDVRFGIRSLRRDPLFSAMATVTLALGIGANLAVFMVLDAVLLQPLPYPDGERIVVLSTGLGPHLPNAAFSGPEFVDVRDSNRTLDAVGLLTTTTFSLVGDDGPRRVRGGLVSAGVFEALGTRALHGRLLSTEDDYAGGPRVVVLSHRYWLQQGDSESTVGDVLNIEGTGYTVVGILPSDFELLHPDVADARQLELWFPLATWSGTDYDAMERSSHRYLGLARMSDGVSLPAARADLSAVAAVSSEAAGSHYPDEGLQIHATGLHEALVGPYQGGLWVLFGAVVLVLIIACVNVTSLQLGRIVGRATEFAVRGALGAGRRRLLQMQVIESLLLAALSTAVGFGLASWLVGGVRALAPQELPRLADASVDVRAVAVGFILVALTSLIFGAGPAALAMRRQAAEGLHSAKPQTARGRSTLIAAEVALAVVLLVGAGLLLRELAGLMATDPGFRSERVLGVRIGLPAPEYDDARARVFWNELVARAAALPGVESAAATSSLPLSGFRRSGTTMAEESEGVERNPHMPFAHVEAAQRFVTPDYFDTLGIALLEGRAFAESDVANSTPVALVDAALAKGFWPDGPVLGRRVAVDWLEDENGEPLEPIWRRVVGVVADVRHEDVSRPSREQIYLPVEQAPQRFMHLVVRSAGDPTNALAAIRALVAELDPARPLYDVRTMDGRLADSVAEPRFQSVLFAAFATLALSLCVIGIYGVVANAVARRTREIGVRMALGARTRHVRRLVLLQGLAPSLAGLAIGLAVSFLVGRVAATWIAALQSPDPVTYAMVCSILVVVALGACAVPTWRATNVAPSEALRAEAR